MASDSNRCAADIARRGTNDSNGSGAAVHVDQNSDHIDKSRRPLAARFHAKSVGMLAPLWPRFSPEGDGRMSMHMQANRSHFRFSSS